MKSKATRKTRRTASTSRKRTSAPRGRRWSARVTETSDAMDLKQGVFKSNDPKKIARSVKRSSEKSHRRKANPYRSAVSMISFYENRGGRNLSAGKKKTLQKAKVELKKQFGR